MGIESIYSWDLFSCFLTFCVEIPGNFGLGSDGAKSLAEALKFNTSLGHLNLA